MPQTQNKNELLHQCLITATGLTPTWTSDVRANPFGWLRLEKPEQLREVAKALAGKVRLCTVTAYAEERDDEEKRRCIAYHFAGGDTLLTVTVPLYDAETHAKLPIPSITPWFRNADWNEREFNEMFNIEIVDHPNPKRLFLDERLDAGIMSKLIPFSAMANSAGTNTLWERILETKGVDIKQKLPAVAPEAEAAIAEPKFTPVAATAPKDEPRSMTLAAAAAPAEAAQVTAEAEPAPKSHVVTPEAPVTKQEAPAVAPEPAVAAEAAPVEQPETAAQPEPASVPQAAPQPEPVAAEKAAPAPEVSAVAEEPVPAPAPKASTSTAPAKPGSPAAPASTQPQGKKSGKNKGKNRR